MKGSDWAIAILLILVVGLLLSGPLNLNLETAFGQSLSNVLPQPDNPLTPGLRAPAGGGETTGRIGTRVGRGGNCGNRAVNRDTGECSRVDYDRLPENGSLEGMFTRMQGWGRREGVNNRIPTDANGNICQIGTCTKPDFAPGEP